jgi:hypothetical protein
MTGAAIVIDDASAADTIVSIKQRVFAASATLKLPVCRQRLMYRPGPHGINPLADDETLGGAGVAEDGTAELDVLLAELTAEEMEALDRKVCARIAHYLSPQSTQSAVASLHKLCSSVVCAVLFA